MADGLNVTFLHSVTMLRQAAAKYEDMIVKDPNFTSNLESALKVASYIIPGAHYLAVQLVQGLF